MEKWIGHIIINFIIIESISKNLNFIINLTDVPERYYTDRNTISILCTIENISTFPEEVFLQDHHNYHGTLNYPTSFFINITDMDGNILLREFSHYFFGVPHFLKIMEIELIYTPMKK